MVTCRKTHIGVWFALALSIVAWNASAMGVKEALAQFETGATTPRPSAADRKIGTSREVSRYQILPNVWRRYSQSSQYQNPEVAWQVAAKILVDREKWFRTSTGRQWDPVDLYLMWNAPGDYSRAKFNRRRVSRVVRERAERFSNLLLNPEPELNIAIRSSTPGT